MKNTFRSLLFSFSIFFSNLAFSQQDNWVQDSLSFYEKTFWTQIKAKDIKTVNSTVAYITVKGAEDLNSKFFEFFTTILKKDKEILYNEVLCELESRLGALD